MNNKDQILTAIASILSADYWKNSYEIADELKEFNLEPKDVRILLRRHADIEMRKARGYRLRSQKLDEIDRAIFDAVKNGEKLSTVSSRFNLTRQAVSYRKQSLFKRMRAKQKQIYS